jgi:hypothetical protein
MLGEMIVPARCVLLRLLRELQRGILLTATRFEALCSRMQVGLRLGTGRNQPIEPVTLITRRGPVLSAYAEDRDLCPWGSI